MEEIRDSLFSLSTVELEQLKIDIQAIINVRDEDMSNLVYELSTT